MFTLHHRYFETSMVIAGVLTWGISSSFAQSNPPPVAPASTSPPTAPIERPSLQDSLTGVAATKFGLANDMIATFQYDNAIVELKSAYAESKDARLLWNIAVCESLRGHFIRAQDRAIEYRKEDGANITAADIAKVDNFVKTMDQHIATIQFELEPDVKIILDGVEVGTSPLAGPLRVDMGSRQIRFEKKGYDSVTEKREISGETSIKWAVKLEKERQVGRLIIRTDSRNAIQVDGKVMSLGRYDKEISAGGHSVRVSAPGMFPWQGDVFVKDKETRDMTVTLVPIPKVPDFSKWGWTAGGVALFAGAIVAGTLLYPVKITVEKW